MTLHETLAARSPDPRLSGIIKLAIMAVGGQGGGVLTGWIESVARQNGYAAQATSVAGVSQRTGATVYYIEMAPADAGVPVFSLMPAAGDVDIMIAAEMMEAGRAIIRGFVTPDRTTLIASTHRALAVSEKMQPGDGIAASDEVMAAAEVAARQIIMADYEALAVQHGSVISASLFGALAASGALPFPRTAFEAAIRAGGKAVDGSLQAFDAAFAATSGGDSGGACGAGSAPRATVVADPAGVQGPPRLLAAWQGLVNRAGALPIDVVAMALPGLQKVVDFQDAAYGAAYLARVEAVLALDDPARGYALTREAAKYIANAMAYDDVIRVADLKTRGPRFARIRHEMQVRADHVLHLTEFMHPRAEEIAGMLPARLGARVLNDPKWMARLDRWFNKGRRLRTDGILAYGALYLLGGMQRWRLRTLRHAQERAHLDAWLARALACRAANYDLAVEVIRCRRLVKGYSDTHARGMSKFDQVLAVVDEIATRPDAADWARRLREAALLDEEGKALQGAIATIRSFT